jgi:transposase
MSGRASKANRKQSACYSGKKKRHTLKAQVVADRNTKKILATAFASGKVHDLTLLRNSRVCSARQTLWQCDSGYQGLQKQHASTELPTKKSKHHPLTPDEKAANRQLAKARVVSEHINARLKVFRILAERYRNRRKQFGLRFNLIAAIYNLEYAP